MYVDFVFVLTLSTARSKSLSMCKPFHGSRANTSAAYWGWLGGNVVASSSALRSTLATYEKTNEAIQSNRWKLARVYIITNASRLQRSLQNLATSSRRCNSTAASDRPAPKHANTNSPRTKLFVCVFANVGMDGERMQ